jgi:hypothetical protein
MMTVFIQAVLLAAALDSADIPVVSDAKQESTAGSARRTRPIPQIEVPPPEGTNRVTAAAVIEPASARPGETVTLFVRMRMAPGHWIYGLEEAGSHNVATSMTIEPHRGKLRRDGPWQSTEPKVKGGSKTHRDEVLFETRMVVDRAAAPGLENLQVTVTFQVCNEALCWPPRTLSLQPCLKIVESR